MKIPTGWQRRPTFFVLSLLIAFFLWLYVNYERNFERTLQYQINYLLAPDIVVVNNPVKFVEVLVRGSGMLIRSIDQSETLVNIDLRKRTRLGPFTVKNVRTRIAETIPWGLELINVQPNELQFDLDSYQSVTLPITATIHGSPAPGYEVESIVIKPESINVAGGQTYIKDLKTVSTEVIDIDGAKESISKEVSLSFPTPNVWKEDPSPVVVIISIKPING